MESGKKWPWMFGLIGKLIEIIFGNNGGGKQK